MNEVPIQITYHCQRSSTGRIRDGKIHLRISQLVSRREQERHINDLLNRMRREMEKRWSGEIEKWKLTLGMEDMNGVNGMKDGFILCLSTGMNYSVQLKKAEVKKYKVQKLGWTLMLQCPIERIFDREEAEETLWQFLMKDQLLLLKQRLDELAEGWIEERCKNVRLRMAMSRWGSCDRRSGTIMLSVKLLLVEPKLLDYVCVHELAHLKYADHSDLFWELVERRMPEWKMVRKRLRYYE